MSIFITDKPFDIVIGYVEMLNASNQKTGIKIVPPSTPGCLLLNCKALGRNYDTMAKIMSDCTFINHVNGKPIIMSKILCEEIVAQFIIEWDAKDEDGQDVPLARTSISKADYKIIRILAREWLAITGGK